MSEADIQLSREDNTMYWQIQIGEDTVTFELDMNTVIALHKYLDSQIKEYLTE